MTHSLIRLVVLLLSVVTVTRGQVVFVHHRSVPGHVWHYVTHHKELLIHDTLLVLTASADAASSVHCQHISPFCKETNSTLGPRPSELATWGYLLGFAGAKITLNHLAFWISDDRVYREACLSTDYIIFLDEYATVKNNVHMADLADEGPLTFTFK